MLFRDCSWVEIERRVAVDPRVVLVLGATEEHSDLSVATDTSIPFEIARKACDQEDVLLAPALPFGISTWSLAYPGTISLRTTTYCAVVEDVVRSLASSGFRKFFVLNGHGMNRAVSPVFGEVAASFPGMQTVFLPWWELAGVRDIAAHAGLAYGHANWAEAFPFTILGERRRAEPTTERPPDMLLAPDEIRARFGMGHGPGPVEAPAVVERMFEAAVTAFVKLLAAAAPTAPER